MRVEVKTPCRPTEDVRKVERAMKNIFPDLDIRKEGELLIGRSGSVDRFGELLKEQRIRSAARAVFLSSRSEDRIPFKLNKQVAFIGKVSFGSDSPLGDIDVTIRSDNIDSVIDSIAPGIGDAGE
jgi:predicted RNA binding protein with dsRBD fold (UPF0201 family)